MKRSYLSPEFKITSWENLKPILDELINRTISSVNDLKN